MTPDELTSELDAPVPPRIRKLLDEAERLGWSHRHTSLVVRYNRPGDGDALPFFARWDLIASKDGSKRSWRFEGARVANGQPLNYNDIFTYLADPRVAQPEPPQDDDDDLAAAYASWSSSEGDR
jgi:hypothetical protein